MDVMQDLDEDDAAALSWNTGNNVRVHQPQHVRISDSDARVPRLDAISLLLITNPGKTKAATDAKV